MIAIEARDACITSDGRVALEALSFATRGDRVLFVGGWSPLVDALTDLGDLEGRGPARLRSGSLFIAGRPLGEHHTIVGVAPRDLLLPGRLTLREYLAWAGRLRGQTKGAARTRADAVLARLGLSSLAKRRLEALTWPERRAVHLAQAIIGDPELVVIEAPFASLDEPASQAMLDLVARATEGRAAVVVLPALEAAGSPQAVATAATDVLVLHEGALVMQGPSAELTAASLYAVTIASGADALRRALASMGAEARGEHNHLAVRLPPDKNAGDILAAAHSCGASIIGCEPLWR